LPCYPPHAARAGRSIGTRAMGVNEGGAETILLADHPLYPVATG
jgi:hypothetical protein